MVASTAVQIAGSAANGIEIQKTIWAYNRAGSLGNTYFARFRMINKSGARIDPMIVGLWSDIDLGFFGDDFVGCDVGRSLGYCYNGKTTDLVYVNEAPPAMGFTLLQGPTIPGLPTDSAVFDNKYVVGRKNVSMTSFQFFVGGASCLSSPPIGNPPIARDYWWNALNGKIPCGGTPYIDPTTREATSFCLSGDPVHGTGWLDGSFAPPGDRRILIATGPFSMQPGDTNEIVVAAMVAQGADNISSITALRATCDDNRLIYLPPFGPPRPPALPNVIVTPLDGAILLSWGDPDRITQSERDYTSKGYVFEGYRVYQTKTMLFQDSVVVATFDRVNSVLDNNGVQHYVLLKEDKLKSGPLINGTTYYFGVSALAHKQGSMPQIIETLVQPLPTIPQSPRLGTRLTNNVFDQIPVTKTDTSHDIHANVAITVIDPTATKTGTYSLTFPGVNKISLSRDGSLVMTSFSLEASTSSTGGGASPIVEGLQVNVSATFDSSFVPNADTCRFSVTGPTVGDIKLAQIQSAQINVFPNPYFGFHANEMSANYRYVTISHLPQRAIIRIYTVAGYLVRSFDKDSPSQFFYWDLMNSWGKRVAAGVYIIHIDMPDIGSTRTVKLGLIPSQ
jgi:hypothetical protein